MSNHDYSSKEKRLTKCEACGKTPVQWHHALDYKGKKLQESFAIRPLCYDCHMGNSLRPHPHAAAVSSAKAIILGLPTLQRKYPKRDWLQELKQHQYTIKQYLCNKKT